MQEFVYENGEYRLDEYGYSISERSLEFANRHHKTLRGFYDTRFGIDRLGDLDFVSESNFEIAKDLLERLDPHHYMINGGPYYDVIAVQMHEDERLAVIQDDPTNYTDAYLLAVALEELMEEYPLLDESDYSEREQNEVNRRFADARDMWVSEEGEEIQEKVFARMDELANRGELSISDLSINEWDEYDLLDEFEEIQKKILNAN